MNTKPLVLANLRQTLGRFRSLFLALVIGSALLVTSAAVVGAKVAAGAHTLDSDSGLSTLELLSTSPSGPATQLTPKNIAAIAAMPGVSAAIGSSSVGGSLSFDSGGSAGAAQSTADGLAGAFWALPRFRWSQPPVLASEPGRDAEAELADNEVLLPDTALGTDLSPLVGARLTFEYVRRTGQDQGMPEKMTVTVAGVYDSASPRRDGEGAIYLADGAYRKVFAALLGSPSSTIPASAVYTACLIRTTSVAGANDLARNLTRDGYYVNAGGGEQNLPRLLGLVSQLNSVVAVLLALFGLGIGTTLAGTWSRLRRWDVGLLSSFGWSPTRILRTYCVELALAGLVIGVSSGLLGTAGSLAGSLALRGQSVLGVEFGSAVALPPPAWLLGVTLGAPIALVLGAVLRIYRLSTIEPDDALRRPD